MILDCVGDQCHVQTTIIQKRGRRNGQGLGSTIEGKPETVYALFSIDFSYHDTEHNQIIPKQITRDEKVRNWIEYTSFTSAYAIYDISHAWSNKI